MSHEDDVFMRTFWLVMAGLTVLFIVIVVVARLVADDSSANDPRIMAKIEERIKPAGQVRTGKISAAAASSSGAIDAKGAYTSACVACHGSGVAGAPKLGDKGAWKARITQGKSTLYSHAIKGFTGKSGMMPAKGGASLSDATVKAIVDYMIAESK